MSTPQIVRIRKPCDMVSNNLILLARAGFDRGVAHLQKGEWDKAVAAFTEALRHDPAHPKAHYFRGRANAARRDAAAAIGDFTRAIEMAPDDPAAYNDRGVARITLGMKRYVHAPALAWPW